MQDETAASTTSGYPMLVVLPVTILTGVAGAVLLSGVAIKILSLVVAVLALICLAGFYMVAPNEGRVLQLPDFPAVGDGFEFVLPPIPRLLPSWQHLHSLVPPEPQPELLARQRINSAALGFAPLAVGFAAAPVGALLALGYLSSQRCRSRTQIRRQ